MESGFFVVHDVVEFVGHWGAFLRCSRAHDAIKVADFAVINENVVGITGSTASGATCEVWRSNNDIARLGVVITVDFIGNILPVAGTLEVAELLVDAALFIFRIPAAIFHKETDIDAAVVAFGEAISFIDTGFFDSGIVGGHTRHSTTIAAGHWRAVIRPSIVFNIILECNYLISTRCGNDYDSGADFFAIIGSSSDSNCAGFFTSNFAI